MRSGRIFIWLLVTAAPVLLSGCTLPNTAGQGRAGGVYKVGSPYQVGGSWYYPKIDYNYDQAGVASWYGQNFHGKLTANGEKFDMRRVSAAHKTLPLPSVVRVTNLENGRSLVLRVNDRGPFVRGRIIDLSERAAELLGFANRGTAMVRVELQADESQRAAIEAGAEGMPEFGPKPPKAAPSVAVSVENLEPEPGMGPTGRYPDAVAEPPVQVASADPRGDPTIDSPPPFDAMTGARGGIPDRIADLTGVPEAAAPAPGDDAPAAAEAAAEPTDPVMGAPREAEVAVVYLAKRSEIYIQAGAFARFENANRLRARLSALGPEVRISQVYVTNQPMFRVRIGPLSSVAEADVTLERMIGYGYPEAQIIVD